MSGGHGACLLSGEGGGVDGGMGSGGIFELEEVKA